MKKVLSLAVTDTMALLLAVPSMASSHDVQIKRFKVTARTQYVTPQLKENNTSCYIKLDNIHTYNKAMINIFGQANNSPWGATKVNCNGGKEDRVIHVGQEYLVTNMVHENGYGYATIGFSRAVTVDYDIQGVWSADSVYQPGLITI